MLPHAKKVNNIAYVYRILICEKGSMTNHFNGQMDKTYIGQMIKPKERMYDHSKELKWYSSGSKGHALCDKNILEAYEQAKKNTNNVCLKATVIKVPVFLVDDIEMATIISNYSRNIPILNTQCGSSLALYAKFLKRYGMCYKEICEVGLFFTVGLMNGEVCKMSTLQNGDRSSNRMPILDENEVSKIVRQYKDKNTDLTMNRIENYSISDSINFKEFTQRCLNFFDESDTINRIEIEDAACVFKKKMLTKVPNEPDQYGILYSMSIGKIDCINLFSDERDALKMNNTYNGGTNCLSVRTPTHWHRMLCTIAPFTSDRLLHGLYRQKRENDAHVKVMIRAVRLHHNLWFDIESCLMIFLQSENIKTTNADKKNQAHVFEELSRKYNLTPNEIRLIGKMFATGLNAPLKPAQSRLRIMEV